MVKMRILSIEHEGGSREMWSVIITFKYNAKKRKFFLYKKGGVTYDTRTSTGVVEEIQNRVDTVKDFGVVSFEKYQ